MPNPSREGHDPMKTIEVPIGPNCHLDGGPFNASEGQGIDHEDTDPNEGQVALKDQEGNEYHATIGEIETIFQQELGDDQPIRINTGDVDDEYTIGTIDIPLVEGMVIETHTLTSSVHMGERLSRSELARSGVESTISKSGATIDY